MAILEKIQKLLKLSKNAGSEAEAALAVERARELMHAHKISEAELRVEDSGEPKAVEEIIQGQVTNTKKKVAWHMRIAGVVDTLYGCHAYWWGGEIWFFGRISDIQAATYTTKYLMNEVEALTDGQAPSRDYSRKYRNGFRLGCASRVRKNIEKLIEEREERKAEASRVTAETLTWEQVAEVRARAAEDGGAIKIGGQRIDADELLEICDNTQSPHRNIRETARAAIAEIVDKQNVPDVFADLFPAKASDKALAVIKRDQDEVDEAYDDFLLGPKNPKTGKRRRRGRRSNVGNVSSHDGYAAGSVAGRKIKINVSRGGLPRGQESLK